MNRILFRDYTQLPPGLDRRTAYSEQINQRRLQNRQRIRMNLLRERVRDIQNQRTSRISRRTSLPSHLSPISGVRYGISAISHLFDSNIISPIRNTERTPLIPPRLSITIFRREFERRFGYNSRTSEVRFPSGTSPSGRSLSPHTPAERHYEFYSNLQDVKIGLINKNLLEKSKVETNKNEEICVICQDTIPIGGIVRKIECSHSFHIDCIDKWFTEHKKCPLCKFSI
jgi:hypothetical protein